MNFNSPEYLLFLPLVFLLHWVLPHRLRWLLLLAASWLFYFHWHFGAGLLLVGTTLLTWLCARGMDRSTAHPAAKRALLVLALVICLGCLIAFKYAGFFASMAGYHLTLKIILPVGISFYTFQMLSYVIDVYRGRVHAEEHFGYYALFVSFFPQLVAGPIERPEKLLPQLRAPRKLSTEALRTGGWLLLTGFFKKLVVADAIAPLVDNIYASPAVAVGPEIVLATLLFGIQIYCDFSGYSDIARGSARLLGIELSENFRCPYAVYSIRDFWRRWHISLTRWFTDYVYIPLGGSRRGLTRQLVNVMVVFLLSGLWHGAGWNFVAWGALHGLYQISGLLWSRPSASRSNHFEASTQANTIAERRNPDDKGAMMSDAEGTVGQEELSSVVSGNKPVRTFAWGKLLARTRTFLLVSFAWLFFRAPSLGAAWTMLSRMGTGWGSVLSVLHGVLPLLPPLLCLPLVDRLSEGRRGNLASSALVVICMLTAVALAWLSQLAGGGTNAFIYFQF